MNVCYYRNKKLADLETNKE